MTDWGKMYYLAFKRIFDIMISALALVAISPFLVAVALVVKLDSRGPVFYRGKRAGLNGDVFQTFKFRTMVPDAEAQGGPSTSDDDPRITGCGKFLRRYKIDELPQLIDVFRGKMSLVGPRPEVMSEIESYTEDEKRVLSVRPGITDWASLEFNNEGALLAGYANPHEAYRKLIRPKKMKLALRYVDERSFLTDIRILAGTAAALMRTRDGSSVVDSNEE